MVYYSSFSDVYAQEAQYLHALSEEVNIIIKNAPSGSLRAHKNGHKTNFSIRTTDESGKQHERYLPSTDPLLSRYISKYCAKRILACINAQIRRLNTKPESYSGGALQSIFQELEMKWGELMPSSFLSNKSYIDQWGKQHFPPNPYHREECTLKTDKGDMVRSKAEYACANCLYENGIAYQYEMSLPLKNGKFIHPDFTIWSHINGRFYYLEICGMMDSPGYREALYNRLDLLTENGIVQGKNLILYFVSEQHPFEKNTLMSILKGTVLAR